MKKRFIAGAVCPKCSAMDRLVIFMQGDTTVRECVECGFTDSQKELEPQAELETRVNHVDDPVDATQPQDSDISPVRILH
ncbi:YheV family putative zinc ribbon protein [Sansalvadorimonas verongulae]|uniref:YheV family putative zinc ribbon protein n=1 Tax=Sansalvadorimonas verongulae TaxID=2172824 RepID=UPI0012BD1875|nr:YheV family putative zinc ribbon protein [Sansalvadorimonas verongulae]MTI13060.1 YheV family putative metal-binding protein [Sansalvadorimonas verongulae]